MDISKLSEPLAIENIEFRTQSIKNGHVIVLAYKDARVDMQRLDDVVGALNWKREHTRDNKNCVVSFWCVDKKQGISKEDTGTESNTEKEKGLASDSFKRACFNWGIGRELYDMPLIRIKLNQDELNNNGGKFFINTLKWEMIRDKQGNLVFLGAYKGNTLRWYHGKKPSTSNSTSSTSAKTNQAPATRTKRKLDIDGIAYNSLYEKYRDAKTNEDRNKVKANTRNHFSNAEEVLTAIEDKYKEYLAAKNK